MKALLVLSFLLGGCTVTPYPSYDLAPAYGYQPYRPYYGRYDHPYRYNYRY